MADDLPMAVPAGTPTITRKVTQPQDEVPEIVIRDGKMYSKDPTKPKERAEFAVEEILCTLDERPLLNAANEFKVKQDWEGFVNCFKNCDMDLKTVGKHLFVTLKPGS